MSSARSRNFIPCYNDATKNKKESERKESEEDDATKNVACRETKWSVKNNNR